MLLNGRHAVHERYLSLEGQPEAVHARLAALYGAKADPKGDRSWQGQRYPDGSEPRRLWSHAVRWLVHHRLSATTGGENNEAVSADLTDLALLEARVASGQTPSLYRDWGRARRERQMGLLRHEPEEEFFSLIEDHRGDFHQEPNALLPAALNMPPTTAPSKAVVGLLKSGSQDALGWDSVVGQPVAREVLKMLGRSHGRSPLVQDFQDLKACNAVALAPDGVRMAVGGDDGRVTLWHATGGLLLGVLTTLPNNAAVTSLSWDSTGARLVVGGSDGHARVWRVDAEGATGEVIMSLPIGGGGSNFDIVSVSWANAPPPAQDSTTPTNPGASPSSDVGQDSAGTTAGALAALKGSEDLVLVVGSCSEHESEETKCVVFNAVTGQGMGDLDSPRAAAGRIHVDYTGEGSRRAITASIDGRVRGFDVSPRWLAIPIHPEAEGGEDDVAMSVPTIRTEFVLLESNLDQEPPPLLCIEFDTPGKRCAVGSEEGTVKVWDFSLSGKDVQALIMDLKTRAAKLGEEVDAASEELEVSKAQAMRKVRESYQGNIGKMVGQEGERLAQVEALQESVDELKVNPNP